MDYDPFKHDFVGKRIRLVATTDRFTSLTPGALGTVRLVDFMDTVHVDWDNGARLGLCEDAGDVFELLDPDVQHLSALATTSDNPSSADELPVHSASFLQHWAREAAEHRAQTYDRGVDTVLAFSSSML